MAAKTTYCNIDTPKVDGLYHIGFLTNDSDKVLERTFENEYSAWKFVNKLRHSRRCVLVYQYPNFKG